MSQTNPKHRRYRVESIRDKYIIVKRVTDGETFTTPLYNVKVGSNIILFERGKNEKDGKPLFNISVTNYFPGSRYTFRIKERKAKVCIVEGLYGDTHAVPHQFSMPTDTKIELQIKEVDKQKNMLLFEQPLSSVKDFSSYEVNKEYTFSIINESQNESKKFLTVTDGSQNFTITLPSVMKEIAFPKEITCRFMSNDNFKGFNISMPFLKKIIYRDKLGSIISLTIEEINSTIETDTTTWKLKDQYNLYHFYNPQSDHSFNDESDYKVGETIQLCLLDFTKAGNLKLIQSKISKNHKTYLIEDIFDAIDFSDQEDDYFFNLSKQSAVKEQINTNFLEQYNDGNNLWIFSYFYALDLWILHLLEDGDFEECLKVIQLYKAFEQWVMEDSDFLETFREHKAKEASRKGESKLESLSYLEKAISLIENDEDEEWIEDVSSKLANKKNVLRERKNIFKELVRISQFISIDSDEDEFYKHVLLLLRNNLLDEGDLIQFKRSIIKKLSLESISIDNLLTENTLSYFFLSTAINLEFNHFNLIA